VAQSNASLLSASAHLFRLSLRRQFVARQTIICLAFSGIACVIAWGWTKGEPSLKKFGEEIVVQVFASFLVPILAICYGTGAVGGEREDRTLVYLLITPMPRPVAYLTKYSAAMILVLAWTAVSFTLTGIAGGRWGIEAAKLFWPAVMLGAAAYTSLFSTLGAAFRRGTIISLAYAMFLEGLLGNMPGIVKRLSLSFYIKCMIYDAGAEHNIGPTVARDLFLPISGNTAAWILSCLTLALLAIGIVTFARREYRDLS
jgi:ABC-type transport system involved in multi-copper enzyme maturation permease subunit